MREITIKYKVYSLEELPPEVQEKACEKFMEHSDEVELTWTLDTLSEILGHLSIPDAKIYYSGFWNQGDGLCFEMPGTIIEPIDLEKLEECYPKEYWEWVHNVAEKLNKARQEIGRFWVQSTHSGRYYHNYSVTLDVQLWEDVEDAYEEPDGFPDNVEEIFRDLMYDMYNYLQESYEYVTSMEYFKELCEMNEYEFTNDGSLA